MKKKKLKSQLSKTKKKLVKAESAVKVLKFQIASSKKAAQAKTAAPSSRGTQNTSAEAKAVSAKKAASAKPRSTYVSSNGTNNGTAKAVLETEVVTVYGEYAAIG